MIWITDWHYLIYENNNVLHIFYTYEINENILNTLTANQYYWNTTLTQNVLHFKIICFTNWLNIRIQLDLQNKFTLKLLLIIQKC